MSAAVELRDDFEADEVRGFAAKAKDANQARRLLAIAAVYDGMDREEAGRIGGMDRQTLRDWVHRFNEQGAEGLINIKPPGRPSKLSAEQKEELCQLVETGPDPQKHLDEIGRAIAPGAHALIILDQAGWHTTRKLKLPSNLTLVPLPPACPELNAAENIWQYLRQSYLSNRVFATYTAILDACQDAWRKLLAETGRITSIATREWAAIGQ